MKRGGGPLGLVDPTTPDSEPFRSLRVTIDLQAEHRRGAALLFTSPTASEGTTTLASNEALVTALMPRRTLLIDGDLVRPSVHAGFGVPRDPGLVDVVRGRLPFVDAVAGVTYRSARLHVLPAGRPTARTGDVVISEAMGDVLALARDAFDSVIIDAPPVLDSGDAAGLAAHPGVDTVVVVDARQRRKLLVRAVTQLERAGANVVGVVLNRAAAAAA
ncbi:MAG: CpsD/CapB family tyrosine-protein kinase [Actinomycetota bacterium]|nr:CpsD/CapB family tyrosine-protein kinase [Actinomycetota bacterium]